MSSDEKGMTWIVGSLVGLLFLGILFLTFIFGSFYIIGPTERGIKISMGKMDESFLPPGFGLKLPMVTEIRKVNVQQQTKAVETTCFSSDLQQVTVMVNVLYRTPESSVVKVVRDYSGDPFDSLVVPRLSESLKEVTAQSTAADIVKNREMIKNKTLSSLKTKVGDIILINDMTISDIKLSKDLEDAIEQKMVQQQAAEKASFQKQQAEVDAQTRVIAAKAEAESIQITGTALQQNPALVQLKMAEKWDGHMPTYVAGPNGAGPNILLPVK